MYVRISRVFLSTVLLSLIFQSDANANENLAKCVQVTNSYLIASSFNPQYVVTLKDACETDLGSISLQFFSGSNSLGAAVPQFRSIFKLNRWGQTEYFDLPSISKGIYTPRLQVTIGKEPWNPQMLYLNTFQITGNSSGSSSNQETPKQDSSKLKEWCISSNIVKKTCYTYPSWKYEICSFTARGEVQEKRGTKWFTLWKVAGVKSEMCSNPDQFLLSTNGQSTGTGNVSLRFWQPSTKTNSAWSDPIKITLR